MIQWTISEWQLSAFYLFILHSVSKTFLNNLNRTCRLRRSKDRRVRLVLDICWGYQNTSETKVSDVLITSQFSVTIFVEVLAVLGIDAFKIFPKMPSLLVLGTGEELIAATKEDNISKLFFFVCFFFIRISWVVKKIKPERGSQFLDRLHISPFVEFKSIEPFRRFCWPNFDNILCNIHIQMHTHTQPENIVLFALQIN